MQLIDLSKSIQFNEGDPGFMQVKIEHRSHAQARATLDGFGLPPELYPDHFEGWADDLITQFGVHSTTHIDAPWHYAPTSGGKPAKTIDQIPLDWCYGDGVVIDMSHKPDFERITAQEIADFVEAHQLVIQPGTIVLIRTDRDRYMGTPEFFLKGTGMSAEATRWLIDRGVKVMGIDQWGWDLPFMHMIAEVKRTGNRNLFWEAHLVGYELEYCHIEQLTNLKALPLSGFKVAVFPLKIVGASAAPARVVAMVG